MGLYSRRTDVKIGDLVLLQEGISASVYELTMAPPCAYVNWIDGPKHELHQRAIPLVGAPHTWGIIKVERLPR